jgi:hypothetical protein
MKNFKLKNTFWSREQGRVIVLFNKIQGKLDQKAAIYLHRWTYVYLAGGVMGCGTGLAEPVCVEGFYFYL